MARLKDMYKMKIAPSLRDKYGYTTPMAIPRLQKIVVSMGLGKAVQDKKFLELATKDMTVITGQKPLVCASKKSVSNFKVRQGDKTGLKVTLRKARMYEFLDRLINLTIPRVKDFRGLNPKGFDGRGNYSMGLDEQSVFPEIDPARIEHQQGMNITFVTSARSDDEAREMLRLFGMPFKV
jgi:large subunit ribosomal protein L5